jgi:hypothetical protein
MKGIAKNNWKIIDPNEERPQTFDMTVPESRQDKPLPILLQPKDI